MPVLLAILSLLLLTAGAPAPQETAVVVSGEVVNGTPDGAVPPDLPVTLRVFAGMELVETYTSTLTADAAFDFDVVVPEAEASLVAEVVYQDVAYTSEFVPVEEGTTEVALPVTIYETTEELTEIQITQLHVFLLAAGDRMQISEYYLVSNSGDRTYVGAEDAEVGEHTTLSFSLPEGASGLTFDGPGLGQRFVEREDGFADTRPVLPGSATVEVFFVYEMAYQEGMEIERTFDVPVSSVVMVVPESGVGLEGEGIRSEGTIDTQMGAARSYTAGPLSADQSLAFTMVGEPGTMSPGAPAGPTTPAERNPRREIGMGLMALTAAGVGIYLMWRAPAPGPVPTTARSLVASMAKLDAAFERGQVDEKAYRNKRASLKRQLRSRLEKAAGEEDRA
jgi:hypothetical protein